MPFGDASECAQVRLTGQEIILDMKGRVRAPARPPGSEPLMDGKSARRPASGRKREPSQAESTHPSVRQSVKRERIQCIRLTGWISVKDKMSCDATFRLAPRAPPGPLPEKWPVYDRAGPSRETREASNRRVTRVATRLSPSTVPPRQPVASLSASIGRAAVGDQK